MMCEHERINATKGWMDKNKSIYPITEPMQICKRCLKTVKEIELETQLAAANNFAKLAGLAIIMRERLRGVHGISVEGPIGSVMKLVQAINDFDAEYARQFPTIREAQP